MKFSIPFLLFLAITFTNCVQEVPFEENQNVFDPEGVDKYFVIHGHQEIDEQEDKKLIEINYLFRKDLLPDPEGNLIRQAIYYKNAIEVSRTSIEGTMIRAWLSPGIQVCYQFSVVTRHREYESPLTTPYCFIP